MVLKEVVMRKYIIGGISGLIVIIIAVIALKSEILSGVPDAINSISSNGDLHLCVLANERNIENKEALAVEIVNMCRNNEFHTIKFSYDIEYPTSLSISVYETRKAFEKSEEAFHIDLDTEDYLQCYNIVENTEQYELYLDGKIINYNTDNFK